MTTAETRELSSALRGLRRVWRPAHECAEAVAARLEPGVTEREARSAFRPDDDRSHMRRWAEAKAGGSDDARGCA
jgi:hypothetical protein